MPVRVYLIRHGETEWSRSGQHTSRTDLPLLPEGDAEARWLPQRLAGVKFSHVLCSPRLRAKQTATIAGLASQLIIEPDLREWEYGDYEGITAVKIRETRPDWDIYRDGCPGGESPSAITARADALAARLKNLDGNIAAFSHGHFLRVLAMRWVGFPLTNAQHFAISTASIGIVALTNDRPGRAVIELWNERGRATG